ncbi:hypothetical protein P43SY_004281 [Pythium insidiosum]|uniref:WW domain-containing protein n=1 Tax=Pythium insidiosum TaxID=114742 RepID=A0AAD5Q6M6_PYTIN|nr:hypothetical protein P43SY_004281 [Pythium insidiosum]
MMRSPGRAPQEPAVAVEPLHAKKSARTPTQTPRHVVVPETVLPPEPPVDDEGPSAASPSLPHAAEKYAVREDRGEHKPMTTGLPSPRDPLPGGRRVAPPLSRLTRQLTLSKSYRFLRQESRLLTQSLLQGSRQLYRQLSLQQLLSYLLILAGMVAECATPAPRYNTPMGIAIFMSIVCEWQHRVVVTGLAMAIVLDVYWLLRPQELSFNGYFRVEHENVMHFGLAVCTMLKIWLLFSTYFDLGPELEARSPSPSKGAAVAALHPKLTKLWSQIKYLFPRKTLPRRSHLSFEVLMRVLTLIWIHGVCGVTLLFLGLVAATNYNGRAPFRSSRLGLPLHVAMILRAATTLMTYVLATQNMSYFGCLSLTGCRSLAERLFDDDESDVVLRYSRRWVRRLRLAKGIDAILGVYVVLVFYSAIHSSAFIIGDGITVILALTAVLVLVLDVWAPLLLMVVVRCGAVLHSHHRQATPNVDAYRPNQLVWESDVEAGNNGKSEAQTRDDVDGGVAVNESENEDEDEDSDSDSAGIVGSRGRRRLRRDDSKRAASVRPLLQRTNSMRIVDAEELTSWTPPDDKPFWVRHWDEPSGRSFLVHSVTRESVWEINAPPARRRRSLTAPTNATPRVVRPAPASFPSARSPRVAAQPETPRRAVQSPVQSARASKSPPTSDSEVIVGGDVATAASAVAVESRPPSARGTFLLSSQSFVLLWDALPDSGGFTCRVSKIPAAAELSRHLQRNGFAVASDGLSVASLRVVHFYALLDEAAATAAPPSSARRRSFSADFFLGEFTFDSLSLKLYAKFRCVDVEAIVPFVKRLQLKDIVGAYAPCD